jgi:hypothetical protein
MNQSGRWWLARPRATGHILEPFSCLRWRPETEIMKQYFNERTLQVLLCIVLIGIAILTWHWTHSAFLCMAACVGFTAIWIAVGFWKTRSSDKNTGM